MKSWQIGVFAAVILLAGGGLWWWSATHDDTNAEEESQQTSNQIERSYTIQRDITYVETVQSQRQILDIYQPKQPNDDLPVVVWLHGGGWVRGDKNDSPPIELVEAGHTLVAVNYRYVTEAPLPAAVHDVKTAVRFLRANAANYGISEKKIVLFGYSAGGHLASLAGLTTGDQLEDIAAGNAEASSLVDGIVLAAAPVQLQETAEDLDGISATLNEVSILGIGASVLLGCEAAECLSAVPTYEPANYLDDADPPVYVQHSVNDSLVPISQAQNFYELAQQAGVAQSFEELKIGHAYEISTELLNFLSSI